MNNFTHHNEHMHFTWQSLQNAFQKTESEQKRCFSNVGSKCALLQQSIAFLQGTLTRLQTKIKYYGDTIGSVKLIQIRDKQKQFIINELEGKLRRLESNQQSTQSTLSQKQGLIFDLEYRCQQLKMQNSQYKEQISKKSKQIKQLIKTNTTLKILKAGKVIQKSNAEIDQYPIPTFNISELSVKREQAYLQKEHYEELQSKLKEMEDFLNEEIQNYKRKNIKLEEEINILRKQLKKQGQNSKKIYEQELKVKNLVNQNKQLQQSLNNQMTLSNQNQLKFHKKINELKLQVQQTKKISKNINKQVEKQIRKMSATILGANDKATIFIGTSSLSDQFDQLAKQILKCKKKQINQIIIQKDTIIDQLQVSIQSYKFKILQLNGAVQKLRKSSDRTQKSPILNGHSISNKSNGSRSEITDAREKQKNNQKQGKLEKQKIQQKYEKKLQQINVLLQEKQRVINDMRKKYDEQQTLASKKLLQLQALLAQKQMQLKYQQKKLLQVQQNNGEKQKVIKATFERELNNAKQKLKDLQSQKQQLKLKYRECEQKFYAKQRIIRENQKNQKEATQRFKKKQKKYEAQNEQLKKLITFKDKTIEQLINKNQSLITELKLVKQKMRIIQLSAQSQKQKFQPQQQLLQSFVDNKQIEKQLKIQNQVLQTKLNLKGQQIEQSKAEVQEKTEQLKKKQTRMNELILQLNKLENQNKMLKNQQEILKQSSQKLKQSSDKSNNFSQLKSQYEKRQKLLKTEGEKIIQQLKSSNKQLKAKNKALFQQINLLNQHNQKYKKQLSQNQQQKIKFNAEKSKSSQQYERISVDCQKKIQDLNSKITQLQQKKQKNDSLSNKGLQLPNFKDRKIFNAATRFKGTDSIEYQQLGIQTELIQKNDQAINTIDIFALQTQQNGAMNKILDLNDDQPNLSSTNKRQQEALRNSNLFINLNQNQPPADDVFQICDENQEINFGQSSLNLQVRQLFTCLRIQIQKLFNEQEISFGITKLLPQALQDDYYELMGYIKQKIAEIKIHNQITFIMADAGNQVQLNLDDSLQLPQLISRRVSQGQSLRKIIQQKQSMIHSLMNQRTSQENTELDEQNQNRFMNQCNVYKREIKQHKKNIDILEMNFQSMKNVIRNVLEAFSATDDMEDDFRETMTMYARVGKLTEKQRSKVNYYIMKYLQIKGLDSAN